MGRKSQAHKMEPPQRAAAAVAAVRLLHQSHWPRQAAAYCGALLLLLASCLTAVTQTNNSSENVSTNSSRQSVESISNWLQLVSGNSNRRDESAAAAARRRSLASGVAFEVTPPNQLFQYQPAATAHRKPHQQHEPSRQILVATANRNARTLTSDSSDQSAKLLSAQSNGSDESAEQQDSEVFVSNICKRDFMLVQVQTSRPFYGVIHTLNHRRKPHCTIEGNGATEYQLNISHVLDSRDPQHCGVIKLSRSQRNEPAGGELLSVVFAIRTHRNVELSDDKFLVLNCTNHCRLADCSNPVKQRQLEMEDEIGPATGQDQRSWWARGAKRPGGSLQQQQQQRRLENQTQAACSVWQFPWLVALACCLAILLAGAAISNCIICRMASFPNRPPAPVPSEADSELEQRSKVKQHTINYDNHNHHKPVDVAYAQTVVKAPHRTRTKSRAEYQNRERAQANHRHER